MDALSAERLAQLRVHFQRRGMSTDLDNDVLKLLNAYDALLREKQAAGTCQCGGPISRNPHPDAGKPMSLLEVGATGVCIPCLTKSRHEWSQRAMKTEAERDALLLANKLLQNDVVPPGYICTQRHEHQALLEANEALGMEISVVRIENDGLQAQLAAAQERVRELEKHIQMHIDRALTIREAR